MSTIWDNVEDFEVEQHPEYIGGYTVEVGDYVHVLRPDTARTTGPYEVTNVQNGRFCFRLSSSLTRWLDTDWVTDIDEERRRSVERREAAVEKRKARDLDEVMAVCKAHARTKCDEVWPGGTVDPDDITWFWNTRLRRSAGMAYHNSAVPNHVDGDLAIGLAPDYYYQHGIEELLEVVRHELIHIHQYEHPDGGRGGHGPKFRQWLDDMDTHRHCKHWSKE
jgi:hypothetical protein